MIEILVRTSDRAVLAWGIGLLDDAASRRYEIPDNLLPTLQQPGVKSYNPDGTLTVTPPAPSPPPTDYSALRGRVITIAQSSVGVVIDQLTATQRLSLLACLLYNAGALDPQTLAVRPLAQWVHDP